MNMSIHHHSVFFLILAVLITGCKRCGREAPHSAQKSDHISEEIIESSEAMVFEEENLSDSSDYYSVEEEASEHSYDASNVLSEEEILETFIEGAEELNEAQRYIDARGYVNE